jgi:tetratricopeptide (TPR) repeat protein
MRKHFIVIAIFIFITGFAPNIQAQQQKPSAKMTAAAELYKQQKWQESVQAFGDVIKDEPNNGRAWYLLGMSLHSLGKYEQAIPAFEKNFAIAQNPSSLYNIACAYSRLKQTDKAFEWLEKALTGGAAAFVTLETDADLEYIRGDARFKKMTEIAERKKKPCRFSAQSRQFDFFLGDWDAFNVQGQKVGSTTINAFADGCGVMENWSDTVGGSGKSINYYDASTEKWYQHWIGSGGGALRYSGSFKNGAMRFEGETVAVGKKTLQKLTFFKIDENTVRQLAEISADEGKTWTISYDFKYVKRK